MSPHYIASLEELKALLANVPGQWSEDTTGKHTFRSMNGGIVNYWPSKGTVQCQGKEPAKQEIEKILMSAPSFFPQAGRAAPFVATTETKQRIFIVHGHDTDARDQLELALRRMGLEPFILMNNAGGGKTLIESLEGHIGSDYSAAFGIVLMTPDDMGYAIKDGEGKIEPRARQNVILETGMLLSSLTRSRMALVVKGHIELPSDLEGIIRLGYNGHIREIVPKLAQNLKDAGFNITSESISAAAC